ncbi:MAG: DUF5996 family protein [Acidimicrobiia bacterium]|nr:DUF5996 family protein [Acidimicrobiia bacterium]
MNLSTLPAASDSVSALHAYSRILGTIRAARSEPHPRWWHASLEIGEAGLETGAFPLGDGSTGHLILDPAAGLITGTGVHGPLEVALGGPAAVVGRQTMDRLGGDFDIDPKRWDVVAVKGFTPSEAANYHITLKAVRDAIGEFRDGLTGDLGPVQLWPHHFDVSFEWFSQGVEVYEEEDGPKEYSKQIGFGFSPGDEGEPQPYFYANPWPFDESFRTIELPPGASWHGESWSGGFLPYAALIEGGSDLLFTFLRAVYEGTQEALS